MGSQEKAEIFEGREWYVSAYAPQGVPTSDHIKLLCVPLSLVVDSIPDRHVAVETLWISVDLYLRSGITGNDQDCLYFPQLNLNQVIASFGIARVIRSKDSVYSEGVPGLAAWVGIEELGQPKPGSIVFLSAAAGGVGIFSGQLAKLKGCRFIGSTGSDDKVVPGSIDFYLDNVGGKMLEAVLNHVNNHARIILCGMICQYNKIWTERDGVRNLSNMIGKEAKMEGYLVGSYTDRHGDFAVEMES